jgi:hypothetical protein
MKLRATFLLAASLLAAQPAVADEGGVSFWLPGQMGSFAAVQGDPGWSLGTVYYHSSADANASRSFRRGGRIAGGLDVDVDLVFLAPSYTFADKVLGAQAAIQVTGVVGRAQVGINATLSGPGGTAISGSQSDSRSGFGDLYPMGSLKWNFGNHNWMTYAMAGVPVGAYSTDRLANLGSNHWALDVGGGYTYLDPKKGHELSAVLGFTANGKNKDTDYKNGTSGHLDWAASQFLSETFHLGLVGYFYRQISGDSGSGATLGDFKSKVSAIGPQMGFFIPVGKEKWYLNFKAYSEFDAQNRPEGWNAWVTLAVPLGGK